MCVSLCLGGLDVCIINDQIVQNVLTSVGSISPHEKSKRFLNVNVIVNIHGREANVFPNKVAEFRSVDFSQAFKARDFRFAFTGGNGLLAFGIGVAVDIMFGVSDAEKRRLQNE